MALSYLSQELWILEAHELSPPRGIPKRKPPSGFCEGCVMGKHRRESFPKDGHLKAGL